MEQSDKLISVIILSYNSEAFISRAISSVLSQDYPRVELIVTDDGSEGFSAARIEEFIEAGKTDGLESYHVLANEKNEGTVNNLWHALDVFTGDYFMVMGADDVYASSTTLSDMMSVFKYHLWKPLVVTGKAEMWSEDMSAFLRYLPSIEGQRTLRAGDSFALFEALCGECIIPIVSTCFKREFIEKVDAFDKRYQYYEDYPTFLRMARKGICPLFTNLVVVKHAAGGIANATARPNLKLAAGLDLDRRLMWATEFLPYKSEVSSATLQAYRKRRRIEARIYKRALDAYDLTASEVAEMGIGKKSPQLAEIPSDEGDDTGALTRFLTKDVFERSAMSVHASIAVILIAIAALFALGGSNIVTSVFSGIAAVLLLLCVWFFAYGVVSTMKRRL